MLEVPPGARPTSARAREALFDVLGPRLAGARWLELYAGSGAVGVEAVSRGAARAVLVDASADVLVRNAEALAAGDGTIEVLASDVAGALAFLARRGDRFDVIFADPPYEDPVAPEILGRGAARLAAGGVLVLQTDAREAPRLPPGLAIAKRRGYGRNVLWFLRPAPDREERPPAL